MKEYSSIFNKIETKWVSKWEKENPAYCNLDTKKRKKFYSLGMFVYPSGEGLHAGHPKNYFPLDAISRFKKMNGYEVLNPMGFDAFGLPAEQHARKTGEHPKKVIKRCIESFKFQFKRLGMFYDWSKEINTSDPNYFKVTQWCFLRLFKTGYAFKTRETVNWCPELGTVLANEETKIINEKLVSEIGNFPVIKKNEMQWVIDIKLDARELLDNLNSPLLDWPEDIKKDQVNWIGEVKIKEVDIVLNKIGKLKTNVITEDKAGSYFLFVCNQNINLDKFKEEQFSIQNKEKGTDKIIVKKLVDKTSDNKEVTIFYLNREFMIGDITSLLIDSDIEKDIFSLLLGGREYDFLYPSLHRYSLNFSLDGSTKSIYRLRNWVFSRQRFWGEPIPIYFDENQKPISVPSEELPLTHPKVKSFVPEEGKMTVLETQNKWINFKKDNKEFVRESFTMPQWAGSSWYHLAYLMKDNEGYLDITSEKARHRFEKWLPVDLYIGGKEHSVLHLIYARFWHHTLSNKYKTKDETFKELTTHREPFFKLLNQGMVQDIEGKKMSKSKGNVVDPLDIVEKFGADSFRVFILFAGAISDSMKLDMKGIESMHSWLSRVWRLSQCVSDIKPNDSIISSYNLLIKKSQNAIEKLKLNVAISFMMEFVNDCYKNNKGEINKKHLIGFLKILHCFAPFISQEIFSNYSDKCITDCEWPTYNEKLIKKEQITYVIQVNGKVRHTIKSDIELSEEDVFQKAICNKIVGKHISDKKIIRKIFIKSKILNLVVK